MGIGLDRAPLPADLTFRQFFDLTGVDLMITGTNLSTNQSKYFSVGYSPEFPVIDAVGLSMAIPLIFKPVCSTRPYVHYEETDDYNKAYTGLWADGGIFLPQGLPPRRPRGTISGVHPPGCPFAPCNAWMCKQRT